MSLFYVWNPSLAKIDPPTLTFVLSTGDGDQIARGSDNFIAGLLRDLGLDAKPIRWSLLPFRSRYFRDVDLGSDDWRDLWPLMWLATVELPGIPVEIPSAMGPLRGTDAGGEDDTTFDSGPKHPEHWRSARCMIVGDFADTGARERAETAVRAAHRRGEISTTPEFSYGEALGTFPTLYVDIGERERSFFEDGAKEADVVSALLETMGGATHHLQAEDGVPPSASSRERLSLT